MQSSRQLTRDLRVAAHELSSERRVPRLEHLARLADLGAGSCPIRSIALPFVLRGGLRRGVRTDDVVALGDVDILGIGVGSYGVNPLM